MKVKKFNKKKEIKIFIQIFINKKIINISKIFVLNNRGELYFLTKWININKNIKNCQINSKTNII
jgi:hypothetical protein